MMLLYSYYLNSVKQYYYSVVSLRRDYAGRACPRSACERDPAA